MAKNNAVAENNTVNNTNEKEVERMANNNVQQEAPVQEQQATPVAQPAAQNVQAPAEVPAEVPQQSFAEKHPKLAAAGAKIKKVGKWVGLGAAVVGGLFVAHKLGEASGFDKATDAYNSRQSGDDPEPDENPDDLGEADFDEVSDDE